MVNLEHKLTVDDLIIEYMICKVKNGYEPSFLASEFIDFLHFFENKMDVYDVLYKKEELFERFFERKNKSDWAKIINWTTMETVANSHLDMEYLENEDDYLIKPNYKFSSFDSSVINTYFMNKYEVEKIRKIIEEFLINYPKRKINMSKSINEKDLIIGKYISAELILNIWNNYVSELIDKYSWPKQCKDIDKYLLQIDLAEIIDLKSIKKDLIDCYDVISKRIAILYNQDKDLKISSYNNVYLAFSNYKVIIEDYEKIFEIAFGKNKSSLEIDLSSLSFTERHEISGVYMWDDDADIKTTTTSIGNEKIKKLVKSLDTYIK